jgi:hypothetical protein
MRSFIMSHIVRMIWSRWVRSAVDVARWEKDCIDSSGRKISRKQTARKIYTYLDNIKIGLRNIGWGGVDWVHLAQDRDQ